MATPFGPRQNQMPISVILLPRKVRIVATFRPNVRQLAGNTDRLFAPPSGAIGEPARLPRLPILRCLRRRLSQNGEAFCAGGFLRRRVSRRPEAVLLLIAPRLVRREGDFVREPLVFDFLLSDTQNLQNLSAQVLPPSPVYPTTLSFLRLLDAGCLLRNVLAGSLGYL